LSKIETEEMEDDQFEMEIPSFIELKSSSYVNNDLGLNYFLLNEIGFKIFYFFNYSIF